MGFWEVFNKIWPKVLEAIEELLQSSPDPLLFYITGHSLGGALAVLSAFELSTLKPDLDITMYNFGAPRFFDEIHFNNVPRVGNHAFAEMYDKQVPNSFRVVNSKDVITG